MRRVVVTGMGIVSSIGNNTQEVLASLHEARSGITRAEKYAELGFRSQVQGAPTLDPAGVIGSLSEPKRECALPTAGPTDEERERARHSGSVVDAALGVDAALERVLHLAHLGARGREMHLRPDALGPGRQELLERCPHVEPLPRTLAEDERPRRAAVLQF